jgi:hypothetical protein
MMDLEKNTPSTGVGTMSQTDGGLEAELNDPDAERVGVDGKYDLQSVSRGIKACISGCMK